MSLGFRFLKGTPFFNVLILFTFYNNCFRPGSVVCHYIAKYLKTYLEFSHEEVQSFIQSKAFKKLENKIMTSLNNGKISKEYLEAEKATVNSGNYFEDFLSDRLVG